MSQAEKMKRKGDKDFDEFIHDAFGPIEARGTNDPEQYVPAQLRKHPTAWDKVTPDQFGPSEDFYVEGDVFHAVSIAAVKWAESKLPEEVRVSATGFKVEPQWIDFIVHRAKQDKLMSREDYTEAMNELHELSRQWE